MEFKDAATEDIFEGIASKAARRVLPQPLHAIARRKLAFIGASVSLADVASAPGSRFEALKGDRVGQYSVRINQQYRICFRWVDGGAVDVEITDYH